MEYHGEKDPRLQSQYQLEKRCFAADGRIYDLSKYVLRARNYNLDQEGFYTAPGLAWQALLKTASEYCEREVKRKDCALCPDEFRLELLRDIDMLLMFEKGIRGVITKAIKRYPKVNNKYMKDQYNPYEKNTHLQYLDVSIFYG